MAIATIVTRGYGNGTLSGDVNLVPTRGYVSAAPPPPSAVSWKDRNIVLGGGLIATQRNPYNRRRY